MELRRWIGVVVAIAVVGIVLSGFFGVGASALTGADTEGPLADAGLDQTVTVNTTVYLDAGGSTAPEGSIDGYEWEIETPAGDTVEPDCSDCVRTSFVPDETGTYAVTVTVTDDEGRTDTDTLYVEVEPYDPPEITVDGPTAVPAGESRTISLDATATEKPFSSVLWYHDGDRKTVDALPDEQSVTHETTITFADPGIHTVNATVADVLGYQASDGITVRATTSRPYLAVTITDMDGPVEEGETLTVEATVENVGEQEATQPVWLTRDGVIVDSIPEISVAPGQQQEVSFTWDTDIGDAGTYEFTAHTVNETDSREATVESAGDTGSAHFDVEYRSTPEEEVPPGELVEPVVRVENTGSVEATQSVTLVDIHGHPVGSVDVTLGPDESQEISTLTWRPTASDVGTGDLRVSTEDDVATTPLTVLEPATFEVEIVDTSEFGLHMERNMTADVVVTNTGEYELTQEITLSSPFDETEEADPGKQDSETVQLDGQESTTIQLTWEDAAEVLSPVTFDDNPDGFEPTYVELTDWFVQEVEESVSIHSAEIVAESEDDMDTAEVEPEEPNQAPDDGEDPPDGGVPIPEIPDDVNREDIQPSLADVDAEFEIDGGVGHVDVDMVMPEELEGTDLAERFEEVDLDPANHDMEVTLENGDVVEINDDGTFEIEGEVGIEEFDMEAGEKVESNLGFFISMQSGEDFETRPGDGSDTPRNPTDDPGGLDDTGDDIDDRDDLSNDYTDCPDTCGMGTSSNSSGSEAALFGFVGVVLVFGVTSIRTKLENQLNGS